MPLQITCDRKECGRVYFGPASARDQECPYCGRKVRLMPSKELPTCENAEGNKK